jgi:hypothetical protein
VFRCRLLWLILSFFIPQEPELPKYLPRLPIALSSLSISSASVFVKTSLTADSFLSSTSETIQFDHFGLDIYGRLPIDETASLCITESASSLMSLYGRFILLSSSLTVCRGSSACPRLFFNFSIDLSILSSFARE